MPDLDDRLPSDRFSIDWHAETKRWRSVFPARFAEWNREHDTIPQAYSYMRDDAKVTGYIKINGKE